MADEYWGNIFREFLLTEQGKASILEGHIRREETKEVSDKFFTSILYNGLTISDGIPILLDLLRKNPDSVLNKCHKILTEIGRKVLEENKIDFHPHLAFRFRLDTVGHFQYALNSVPKEGDIGKLVEFCGTVVKTSQPRMIEKVKRFRCAACKTEFQVLADISQNNQCVIPSKCPNRESCQGGNLKELPSNPIFDSKDYQEIKIQEKVGKSAMGKIPRSVWVILDEDLIDTCKAGDDVIVIGVVARRWGPLGGGPNHKTEIEYVLTANNVQVNNFQKSFRLLSNDQIGDIDEFWNNHQFNEAEGRNKILASFCPQVYGLYAVKLAFCVVLCGGLERIDPTGTRIRGEPHMLLVGDPGTGKSQILRYAAKLISRSVMTTGIGSTSAGLTASATKEGGQWHLEAGALVLADGGICCIDEFNSIKEVDRVAIHEAMEQQSISVAKAGLVCQLRTRCSILASTNPKGKYDPEEPMSVNVGIASPLLSRFDLVYLLLDSKNPSWDKKVSSYILQGKDPMNEMSKCGMAENLWTFSMMQSYFIYCKQFTPTIGPTASKILTRYYQRRRASAGDNMARTTVRLLQSAIRLSEAHARFMCHNEVSILDAVTAVLLLDTSMDSNGSLVSNSNPLHTTFPTNPTQEYLREAESVLTGLGLHDIWQEERKRILDNRGKRPKKVTKTDDTSPNRCDNSPNRCNNSPNRCDTSPNRCNNSPDRCDTSPNRCDTSPNRCDTLPDRCDTSPDRSNNFATFSAPRPGNTNTTQETEILDTSNHTGDQSLATKLRSDISSGTGPVPVVFKAPNSVVGKRKRFQFVEDNLDDLDNDLEDFPSKKIKSDRDNISFSISQDIPVTSTQLTSPKSKMSETDQNRVKDVNPISESKSFESRREDSSSPNLSSRTLAKLRSFAAPSIEDEQVKVEKFSSHEDEKLEKVLIKVHVDESQTMEKSKDLQVNPPEQISKKSETLGDTGNGSSIFENPEKSLPVVQNISVKSASKGSRTLGDTGNGSSIFENPEKSLPVVENNSLKPISNGSKTLGDTCNRSNIFDKTEIVLPTDQDSPAKPSSDTRMQAKITGDSGEDSLESLFDDINWDLDGTELESTEKENAWTNNLSKNYDPNLHSNPFENRANGNDPSDGQASLSQSQTINDILSKPKPKKSQLESFFSEPCESLDDLDDF